MKKITIAIDGYSSTGKSTTAKQLVKYLGYIYLDSGEMYRAVALFVIQNELYNHQKLDISNMEISCYRATALDKQYDFLRKLRVSLHDECKDIIR